MGWLRKSITSACFAAFAVILVAAVASAEQAAPAPQQADLRTPSERWAKLPDAQDPSFRRHVIPLLARVGCSSRDCHGSFQGRGGFRLSLFGSEWDHDFIQLTQSKGDEDELHVDREHPDQSLILLKPTMQVKHKGKLRFKKDGWEYNLLLKWIKDGAKDDSTKTGELQRLDITPSEMVFNKIGQTTQLRVIAHWTDGTAEDVTELTRFKTNDETVATVSESGLVTCAGKGDSQVVASYDNGVKPIPVMLPVSDLNGDKFPPIATHTKVDELVISKLRKMGIVPSPVCTDDEFLRRVSLDLTGTLPTPDEVEKFIADPSSGKRAAKIEELLNTPAYAAWWTTKFCDYTGNSPRELNVGGVFNRNPGEMSRQWYDWLYKRIAENQPYDQIVADIVLATSRTSPDQSYKDYTVQMDTYFKSDHPTNYADHPTLPYFWQRRNVLLPQDKALAFSHAFLGVKLECAQCHKHPFDRWTKQDFAQFTAFFTPIVSGPRPPARGEDVTYQGLVREITKKVTTEVEGPDAANTDKLTPAEKAELRKKDAKKFQQIQKGLREESARLVDAGQPAPWPELWINPRLNTARVNKKNKGTVDLTATPKILGGPDVKLSDYPDPRKPLMDWLRSPSNPYFAKAFVNRVWATYFNRGIVDPPDDMNLANAPCNAELLNYLAEGFVNHHYDMKWLHREILNSDTYQRSWRTNPTNELDKRNFSHEVVRQLPAEVMLDAVDQAIAPDSKLASMATDIDTRAIGPVGTAQYAKAGKAAKGGRGGADTYFLTLFGKPTRETNCDCERTTDPTLLQTLFVRNDPQLLRQIEGNGKPDSSWISQLQRTWRTDRDAIEVDKLITEAFLRTVSRPPTAQERADAKTDIAAAKTPVDGVRDLLWAMLNTREFKVNH